MQITHPSQNRKNHLLAWVWPNEIPRRRDGSPFLYEGTNNSLDKLGPLLVPFLLGRCRFMKRHRFLVDRSGVGAKIRVIQKVNQLSDARCQLLGIVLNRPRGTAGGYFKKNFETMAKYTSQAPAPQEAASEKPEAKG